MTGVSLSASLHVLAPLRRRSVISLSTTIGALVGVPVVAFRRGQLRLRGRKRGLALAEAVVVSIQLPTALICIRRMK